MFITIGKSLPTIALAITLVALSTRGSAQNPWEKIQRPSSQPSASIGQYTNGCLSGAKQMPLRG
ncbi:MAG: penicillin-insensitive murein endopeptidase, partial [Gammaproteobacteria bacterium]|nr:penicillin-insensitive murein endopeptidase [Gammaproteobacteria bacterium]